MKKTITFIAFFLLMMKANAQDFITRWDLGIGAPVSQITFGVATTGTVNYTWETVPAGITGSGTFTGDTAIITGLPMGTIIRLKINPTNFTRIYMPPGIASFNNLIDVEQWGAVNWTSMEMAFYMCLHLNISATDIPNLSMAASMSYMFYDCKNLNSPSNIGSWNVGAVQNMKMMFAFATFFNQNIGNWNIGAVQNMEAMFGFATSFNQDIGNWNTGAVLNMKNMFYGATTFNQDIGNWNTGALQDMTGMFGEATSFNQDIGNWNTGAVQKMKMMFALATSFNQDIGNWNTGAVQDMETMFFRATSFNQNIGNWNTVNVQDMGAMFFNATSFNQNIGAWQLTNNLSLYKMLDSCGMDCSNYSSTLAGWSSNSTCPMGRSLGAINIAYGSNVAPHRDFLINTKGWTITGDIVEPFPCGPTASSQYTQEQNGISTISPNPANQQTTLNIQCAKSQEATIKVYNAFGDKVFEDKISLQQGENAYTFNTSNLASGLYMVRTQMTNNEFVNRLAVFK